VAGIGWVDLAVSNDDLASDAMTSADLGIRAEMECVIHAGWQVINHGGQLPDLPAFSIVLYVDEQRGNELNQTLVGYLERVYIPVGVAFNPRKRHGLKTPEEYSKV
jgi:hypothetical protein